MSTELGKLCWFALSVRPQHEKVVAHTLGQKGYEELLPLCRSRRRWSDRLKEIDQPLFAGYVFCRFDVNKRLPILITPGVSHIVGAGKTPVPVADEEIESLKSIMASGVPARPWPFLRLGQKVRVTGGSLEGLEGILIGKKPYRLVVSLSILQRSVAVEIDEDWVIPASTSLAPSLQLVRTEPLY